MASRKTTIGMVIVGLALLLLVGCIGDGSTSGYAVSGTVTGVDGNGIKGVALSFKGYGTADTDEDGKWRKDGLRETVKVSPTKEGWSFEPSSQIVSKADSSVNFVATMLRYPLTIRVMGAGAVNQEVLVVAQGTEYEHGTQLELTAIPQTGWSFSHWEGDLTGRENPATIVMDEQKSVTAIFVFSLQKAIDSAEDGDIIIVPPGTYFENLNLNGKNITLTSTNPEDPEIVGMTVIDGGGKGAVIRVENGETEAVITGLTITNGSGRSIDGTTYGGGVYVEGAAITLTHNIIKQNSSSYGAGVYIRSIAESKIINNTISGNSSSTSGGGVYLKNGAHTIMSNTISENVGPSGSGMSLEGGAHTIEDNIISRNSGRFSGGGMWIVDGTHIITDNTIAKNSSNMYGGGVCFVRGYHTITDNLINGNYSRLSGGGLSFENGQHIITDNIISENSGASGGGMHFFGGHHIVTDNIVSANSASNDGGGIYLFDGGYVRLTMNSVCLNIANGNGGAMWVSASSKVVSDDANDLPKPDTFNSYMDNTPDDIFYE